MNTDREDNFEIVLDKEDHDQGSVGVSVPTKIDYNSQDDSQFKDFQSGYCGRNASRRDFGVYFDLPSHGTIFVIDIDSFKEKPWNRPGANVSDYFNFGLNENSWKEYCDDLSIATARPIEVVIGADERTPSIDIPRRMRVPDLAIEIVLKSSIDDDSSVGYGATDLCGHDASKEEDGAVEQDGEQTGNEGSPQSLDHTMKDNKSSRDKSLDDKFETSHGERQMKCKVLPSKSHVQSTLDGNFVDDNQEVSNENMEGKDSRHGLSFKEKGDVISNDNSSGSSNHHSTKISSQIDASHAKAKATSSSDNSRATGSGQDVQKRYNVVEDEGAQDEYSSHPVDLNRNYSGSLVTEKIDRMRKRKDVHRDSDPHSSHVKSERSDLRRERNLCDSRKHDSVDPHRERRKEVEHARRDYLEKEEITRKRLRRDTADDWLGSEERRDRYYIGHRKREESLDRQKRRRRDLLRQRERAEQRRRERDDKHHSKQSYEEIFSRREREDGCSSHLREDKYKGHERDRRKGEQPRRKDRVEDASNPYRDSEEKRSRKDNPRAHERSPKESSRSPSNSSEKLQEDKIGRDDMVKVKNLIQNTLRNSIKLSSSSSESSEMKLKHQPRKDAG